MTERSLNENVAPLEDMATKKAAVKENIEEIRKNIAAANTDGREISIVAATKNVPAELINYACDECGITEIGENRVQELLAKYPLLTKNIKLHFIGQLQTNKVKYIVDKVSLIQSLDSERLAKEIERCCAKIGKTMDVLVELNVGNEAQKGGVGSNEIESFFDSLDKYEHIRPIGIMTIAPRCEDIDEYRTFFEETYRIFIDICAKKLHNIDKPVLSMGMSSNYAEAVSAGSNMVRPGTAIFGIRKY